VNFKRVIISLIVLIISLGLAGCGTPSGLQPYSEERVDLSKADRDALVVAARGFLTDASYQPDDLSENLTKPYGKDVFVTVFAPRKTMMRAIARKKSIIKSLEAACTELRKSAKFTNRFGKQLKKARIAIHVIDEVKPLKSANANKLRRIVEPGIHGLIFEKEGTRTFQLGEDVLFRGWGMKGFGDRDRVMGRKMAELQLKKLAKAAKVKTDALSQGKLYFFTVHPMVERKPGGKSLRTYRGMKLYKKKIPRKQLLESAWLAANNLAMHTDPEGKLGYHYMIHNDEFSRGYNIVRHAGSVWGLFTAYKATGDVALLEAGRRALDYLGKSIMIAKEDKTVAYLDYKGRSLLGTNALAAMSLAEIPQELLDDEWKKKREMLGNGLIAFQVEDGRFYTSWDQVLKKKMPKEQARYFPGEAFLAFMKLYDVDPQQKWLNAAKKCAKWQMDEYDKRPSQQPDAWVVQALSKLYRVEKDERIPDVVFRMVQWHFRHQWGMEEKMKGRKLPFADYYGGADNSTPPRSTPTSARNEANVEAWHLARFIGNEEMEAKLAKSVMAALWHNIVDQVYPETGYWARRPDHALGGIRGALISGDVRIDYNQHYLSAAINALDLAEQLYGDGAFSNLSQGKILDVYKLKITADEAAKRIAGQAAAEQPAEPAQQ